MASVNVVDETFLVVTPPVLAARLADPAVWAQLWPDLTLTVFADRGDAGIRWSVTGEWVGSMEIWLEPVADGTVLHWFLRVDPAPGTPVPRDVTREVLRRQRASKRIAFALKAELERGRAPGEPPLPADAATTATPVP